MSHDRKTKKIAHSQSLFITNRLLQIYPVPKISSGGVPVLFFDDSSSALSSDHHRGILTF